MTRWLLLLLGLVAVGAFAASPELRSATIAQLRSIAEPLFEKGAATEPRFDKFYVGMVEALPPQEKVEHALELAINRREGASEYVIQNAQGWRGTFKATSKLKTLINTAGDSPLIEVRMASFEVYLAEYGLEKSSAEVDRLLQQMAQDPQKSSAWVLWNIGVLGARGVDRERVFRELLSALHTGDEPLRHWAVDALAKFGGVESIAPLLDVATREPSAAVRERAFCALAQSGTFHVAERYEAVPGLYAIASDKQADRQSVTWAFQALREITDIYDLHDDAAQWELRLKEAGLL
jgi:HEAT repeat protein